jgi:hypothetical protein
MRAAAAAAALLLLQCASCARLSIGAPPACASLTAPYLLSADGKLTPSLGTSTTPLFTWAVPASQPSVGAVRVQVFSLDGALAWDSAPVAVGAPGATPWSLAFGSAAPPLAPGAPFSWRAATRGAAADAWSAWSANATGATALTSFSAAPIWAPAAAPATPAAPQFVLLRAVVALPPGARVAAALAFATAQPQRSLNDHENGKLLGAYKLYVGGALVGAGPGRPGRCGPQLPDGADCTPEHLFDTYNVTAAAAAAAQAGGGLALALACFAAPGEDAPRALAEVAVFAGGLRE